MTDDDEHREGEGVNEQVHPPAEQIRIGRLERRIVRLQKSRDRLEKEIQLRDEILRFFPQAEKLHEQRTKLRRAQDQVQTLTQANKEQADTIRVLTKALDAADAVIAALKGAE